MYPSHHLILGTLFALILLAVFPQIGLLGVGLIILSTFFIDVDHYFFYVYKKRNFNLKKAYAWFIEEMKRRRELSNEERRKYKHDITIFHGVEFWLLLILLYFFYYPFIYIFTGIMFHIFLDIAALAKEGVFLVHSFANIQPFLQ